MRMYRYVGPADVRAATVRPGGAGRRAGSVTEFHRWAAEQSEADLAEPFTFVVDRAANLRLAPRRSEHVSCAGGGPVLSAGEMSFGRAAGLWYVSEVSNQSTGYCPDVVSWPAVAQALGRAGLRHPPGFTHEVVFRRCPRCREHTIVREGDFVCVFCGSDLPEVWNLDAFDRDGGEAR